MVAEGIEVVIDPGLAGLSPEQVRHFTRAVMAAPRAWTSASRSAQVAFVSRRGRLTSRAALSARTKDSSQTPPTGASPASGPSSWL